MAKIMAQEFSGITGNVGTLAWAAPEMLLGARCTEKADIYAYGVVLWEICTAQTPVRGQLRDVHVPDECPAEVRELILDCLATNPRNRPTAKEIVERLRAMPDAPPPGAPAAAGSQRSRLGGRRRSGALPPPPGADAEQQAAAGGPQATAVGPAAALNRTPSGRLPPPRRSSESDTSLRSVEAAGSPAYLPSPQALPAAYASPVPGSEAALAAQRLLGFGAAGRTGSAALAGRRAGSMVPGALPSSPTALQLPPVAPHRLHSASSSPPGALPEVPMGPAAQRAASLAGATLRVQRPPRPAPSIPLAIARQASLDDPAAQLAELQRTLGQAGAADAQQWQRRLQLVAQLPAVPLEQVPYQLRGSQLLPPLGQGEQSTVFGPKGLPQLAAVQQEQWQGATLPPVAVGQSLATHQPGAASPPGGPSLAAQLARLQTKMRPPGSPPQPPAGQAPQQAQQGQQQAVPWGAGGEQATMRPSLRPSLSSSLGTVRSSASANSGQLGETQQYEQAVLSAQQRDEHAELVTAQHAAQQRMLERHRSQQQRMDERHQHELHDAEAQQQDQEAGTPQQAEAGTPQRQQLGSPAQQLGSLPPQQLGTPQPHQLTTPQQQEPGPAPGSPLHAVQPQGLPPATSPFARVSDYLLSESHRAASPRLASPFAQPAAQQAAAAPAAAGTPDWASPFAQAAVQQAEAPAAVNPFAVAAVQHPSPLPAAVSPFATAAAQRPAPLAGAAVSPFAAAAAQRPAPPAGAAVSPFAAAAAAEAMATGPAASPFAAAAAQQGSPPAAASVSPFATAAAQQAGASGSAAGLRQGSQPLALQQQQSSQAVPATAGSYSRLSDYLRQSYEKSASSPSHISPFAQQQELPRFQSLPEQAQHAQQGHQAQQQRQQPGRQQQPAQQPGG